MTECNRARRLLVIYNPTAGARSRRRLLAVREELRRLEAPHVLRETAAPGDAERLAAGAAAEGFDAVVAAGGDGTINEVVNGLARAPLPLAVLPFGTANVLANEIGLPRRARALARVIAFAPAHPVFLGEVSGARGSRLFTMMAGIGFDAEVVATVDPALKRRFGKLAYVLAILQRLWAYRPHRYQVRVDGETQSVASMVAANGHFYGGRFVLAPAARLDEAALHFVLFRSTGRFAALRSMVAMGLGLSHRLRDVTIVRATDAEVTAPPGAGLQLDGDILAHAPVRLGIAARTQMMIGFHPAAEKPSPASRRSAPSPAVQERV